MNSFFASVEQLDHKAYHGKPVGVIPIDTDSTSFIAASYEAKQLGVGMGMPVWEARRRFPQLIIVKARPARYVEVHKELLKACDKHAPPDKVYSIDEWSVRLTPREQAVADAAGLAMRIKRQIAADLGEQLRCSAGIAPTRLLAKIACDLQKPDGLTALMPADLPARLEHLEMHDLPGISTSMTARLHKANVRCVRDLWGVTRQQARAIWRSVVGEYWWCGFHGIDVPEIATRRNMMGHSNVLEPRFRNEAGAHGILVRLLCKLAMRLRFHGYFANHLSAWVRHECGRVWVDEIALPCLQDTPTILQQFEKIWQRRQRGLSALRSTATHVGPPKKVAVDVLRLVEAADVPEPLFEELNRPLRLSKVMDQINQKAGGHKLYFGSMHDYRHAMDDKIAFGRVPDETLAM
jgi:DNA polymerase-4